MLDKQEREKLVLSNVDRARRYMLGFAKKFRNLDLADLRGEAMYLLVKASRTFDPDKTHTAFSAYYYKILRNGFIHWLNRQSLLHFPSNLLKNTRGQLSSSEYLRGLAAKSRKYCGIPKTLSDGNFEKQWASIVAADIVGTLSQDERCLMEKYFLLKESTNRSAVRVALRNIRRRLQIRRANLAKNNIRFKFSSKIVGKIFGRLTPRQKTFAAPFYGINQEPQKIDEIAANMSIHPSVVCVQLRMIQKTISRMIRYGNQKHPQG